MRFGKIEKCFGIIEKCFGIIEKPWNKALRRLYSFFYKKIKNDKKRLQKEEKRDIIKKIS